MMVGEVILAVKVTACPLREGFADYVIEVALVVGFTTCVRSGE